MLRFEHNGDNHNCSIQACAPALPPPCVGRSGRSFQHWANGPTVVIGPNRFVHPANGPTVVVGPISESGWAPNDLDAAIWLLLGTVSARPVRPRPLGPQLNQERCHGSTTPRLCHGIEITGATLPLKNADHCVRIRCAHFRMAAEPAEFV